jgi:hypothetical protein
MGATRILPRSRGFTAAFSVPAIHVYNPQSMAYASFLTQQIIIVKPVHLDRSIRLLSSTLGQRSDRELHDCFVTACGGR